MKNILTMLLLIGLLGCREELINEALLVNEPIDISGNWTVSKVYQNEVDITDNFDFSSFNLALNYNGSAPSTFSIASDKRIPFISNLADGNWDLDDMVYPSELRIVEDGNTLIGEFAQSLYPTGNTTMAIEFSLGCSENTYTYHLTKN